MEIVFLLIKTIVLVIAGIGVGILMGIIISAYDAWIVDREFRRIEKQWREDSFDWKGYRLSKRYYEVIDGELRAKE